MENEQEHFSVDSIELAAYILCNGFQLVGTRPVGDTTFLQFLFAIEDRVRLTGLCLRYDAGGQVPAKQYADRLRELRIVIAQHVRSTKNKVVPR